jgi:hypothetical protein
MGVEKHNKKLSQKKCVEKALQKNRIIKKKPRTPVFSRFLVFSARGVQKRHNLFGIGHLALSLPLLGPLTYLPTATGVPVFCLI